MFIRLTATAACASIIAARAAKPENIAPAAFPGSFGKIVLPGTLRRAVSPPTSLPKHNKTSRIR